MPITLAFYHLLEQFCKLCQYKVSRAKGQASPVYYGQPPQDKIPSSQKSPPLVPLGLHSIFVGFRTIRPAVVFSVLFFTISL